MEHSADPFGRTRVVEGGVIGDAVSSVDDEPEDLVVCSYDFEVPERLIAQHPAEKRQDARLMLLDRDSQRLGHHRFAELPDMVAPGDVLVMNDSRVFPARLRGHRRSGGAVEMLALRRSAPSQEGAPGAEEWLVLLKPASRLRLGEALEFPRGLLVTILSREPGCFRVSVCGQLESALAAAGEVPLPPYIKRPAGARREERDLSRYQTVYAAHSGSAAAPTAGLHFTRALLEALEVRGVELLYLTLHVGLGTFSPVRGERVAEHSLHSERYSIAPPTWARVLQAKREGRRVIAVGTTSIRVLETLANNVTGAAASGSDFCGATSLFIYPGFEFKVVDAVITNFHVPRSSLLMLVSAFAGRRQVLRAYRTAIEQGYRFFSYGDAMFII